MKFMKVTFSAKISYLKINTFSHKNIDHFVLTQRLVANINKLQIGFQLTTFIFPEFKMNIIVLVVAP